MTTQTADVEVKLNDRTLFGNDAAEDEDIQILTSYFTSQSAFSDFIDTDVRLQFARARKGMGKSALLSRFSYELTKLKTKPLVVQIRPSSLSGMLAAPETENTVILENYWMQAICKSINFEIASTIGFAWRDDSMALVENAELAGFKGKNLISALTSRLIGKINLGVIEIKTNVSPIQNHERILSRIQEEQTDARDVWFLLDDIDANFKNTPQQQAYISSFFSASRAIVREIRGVSIRATVRSDVWTSLRESEELDKAEQYMCDIAWSIPQQKEILTRRIYAYIMRKHPNSYVARNWTIDNHSDDYIELAFAKKLKWGGSTVPAINVLKIFAAGRPRWMIQLCRLAGNKATVNSAIRITSNEVNLVMPVFGRLRLSDLYKEHDHQFHDLKKVVEIFSNGASQFTTDELMNKIFTSYIKRRSAKSIPEIDGIAYKDSLQLAHFLFKCGFIVAHNQADATLESPEFVTFETRADLLTVDTNLDDGMRWEVQASYRKALNIR